jgi:hypothetical protein
MEDSDFEEEERFLFEDVVVPIRLYLEKFPKLQENSPFPIYGTEFLLFNFFGSFWKKGSVLKVGTSKGGISRFN